MQITIEHSKGTNKKYFIDSNGKQILVIFMNNEEGKRAYNHLIEVMSNVGYTFKFTETETMVNPL